MDRRYSEWEAELAATAKALNRGFQVLSARLLSFAALAVAAGLFAWSALDPNVWRLSGAVLFTAMTFLPALWADARAKD